MNADLFVSLAALAAAGGYTFDLWHRPYARCRSCKGSGRVARSGKRWGRCPACKDKPPRSRIGAAAVAALVGERYGKRYW